VVPLQATVIDATHITVPGQITGSYSGGGQLWPDNQRITNGVQIQQIINFANAAGVAIQAGTIDLAYTLPIYPVRSVSCASALQICLKPQPDAATWIDYTTTPPTFNCRARANLAAVSLPYGDGIKHTTSQITPRYDLQPPSVVLQYQKISTTDSGSLADNGVDAYPLGSDGRAVGSMVVAIDLRGAAARAVSIVVEADALPNLPSGDAPSLAWWTQKKSQLGAVTSLSMISGSLTVKDDNHNDLTSTWASQIPNEYKKGEILSWMGLQLVWVTIAAKFKYYEKDSALRSKLSVSEHDISVRVKLTNSPAGQKLYSALESLDPGESAPAGLAQQIYNTLQVLQYEGSHVIVDPGLSTTSALINTGNKLEITGGAAAWATMDATIQTVDYDLFNSKCEIGFGPAKHIAPGDLEELLQFWRFRTVYDNPNLRISGRETQSQGGQLGGDTAAENTSHGNPLPNFVRVQAGVDDTTTVVQQDANERAISLFVVQADNTQKPSTSAVFIALDDLEPDGTKREASFQWLAFKDSSDCSVKKALFLMTTPEPG